jgi:hypothetical protein
MWRWIVPPVEPNAPNTPDQYEPASPDELGHANETSEAFAPTVPFEPVAATRSFEPYEPMAATRPFEPYDVVGSAPEPEPISPAPPTPTPPPTPARPRFADRSPDPTSIVAGIVFFLLGGAYLLASSGHLAVNAAWTVSLLFIGLGLAGLLGAVFGARRRR